MNNGKLNIIWIFIIFFFLSAAILFEKVIGKLTYNGRDIEKFRATLLIKQQQMDNILLKMVITLPKDDIAGYFFPESLPSQFTSEEEDMELLVYQADTLRYWSDNAFPVNILFSGSGLHNGVTFIGNTWYWVQCYDIRPYTLVGMIKLKSEYPYENRYLKNLFQKDFHLPSQAKISVNPTEGFEVKDNHGNYLMSLVFPDLSKRDPIHTVLILFLYTLSFVCLLLILRNMIIHLPNEVNKKWAILLVILFLLLMRWMMLRFHIPVSLYSLELFSPRHFATSNFLPSLGDFFINSVIFLFVVYLFYHYYHIAPVKLLNRKSSLYIFGGLYLAVICIYFEFIVYLFRSIIINSDISFEAHKIIDITVFSFLGLFSIALHFIAFIYVCDKFFNHIKEKLKVFTVFLLFLLIVGASQLIYAIAGFYSDIFSGIFLVAIFTLLITIRYGYFPSYQFSRLVFLVFLFAVFSTYFILSQSAEKIIHEKKVLAVNLATEHDPIAELLIEDAEKEMKKDTLLYRQLFSSNFDFEVFYNHIKSRHFSGYLEKFDVQVTICDPYETVLIEPDYETFHCYSFFDELVKNIGIRVPGTRFYYLDNLNGRVSYFGFITFKYGDEGYEKTLFIQLETRLVSDEIGYPELMLDESTQKPGRFSKYSYAKYFNNKLVARSGDYKYNLEKTFDDPVRLGDFLIQKYENYDHLIHKVDVDNYIIISNSSLRLIDSLILFSYIFAFYFVLIAGAILVTNLSVIRHGIQPSFKNRIQYSFISVLFLSLLVVGTGTILLSIRQYKVRNTELLREKMQSVYIELIHKLEFEKTLTAAWYSDKYGTLDDLLRKFSNVFYTDINLYDPQGKLLATSRPEVFKKGLMGTLIHPQAYHELIIHKKAEWIHEEQIGQMRYLSAYVPFANNENTLLAYLNLPYFIKQDTLAGEVYTLVVAMVNIYVLLILIAVAVAILISNQITQPLRLIQRKIGELQLGKESEKIRYDRNDEIGGLVQEYNRMVGELQNSAELLARSERETAWREMAKQVAHEIKNPLTPMRLSVQYLLKQWKDKKGDMDEYLEKFSQTLIEQIDSLSTIASEFSNFAKIPQAKFVKINLVDKLSNVIGLFENTENIEVMLDLKGYKSVYVLADKEQLARVFINIIKNAIQSIPVDRKGRVELSLLVKDSETAVVSIKDNGNGISEEMKAHMFIPNFTTKTSGMGLGLAIAKNIIEQANGNIYYETNEGKGTIFFIEIPLYKDLEDIKPV